MWEVQRLEITIFYMYMYISSYFEIPVDTGEPCDAVEGMTDIVCGMEVKETKNI